MVYFFNLHNCGEYYLMFCQKLKFLIITFTSFLLFWMGCFAHQGSVVELEKYKRYQSSKKKLYHPKAADLVIQGTIFDLKHDYTKALLAFQEALLYDSTSVAIYNAIAKDYIYLGKIESALHVLKRGLKFDPNFFESHELLARIYHRTNKIDLAEKEYLTIIKLNSANVDAHLNLATIYLSQNKVYSRSTSHC